MRKCRCATTSIKRREIDTNTENTPCKNLYIKIYIYTENRLKKQRKEKERKNEERSEDNEYKKLI